MKRSYKYRLYLSSEQACAAQHQLDLARELYNACLEERRAAWRMVGKSLTYYDQANQLKEIRQLRPDLAAVNYSMLQAICRRAQRAFDAFYRGRRRGLRGGFPRFKSRHRWDSITFPSYGDGCRLTGTRLRLQGIGALKVKLHRPLEGTIKTVTLKRELGKWFVIFACDVASTPLPATGGSVGIDLGLIDFLTTDSGITVANPRHLRRAQQKLRRAQRALARCQRGSKRRTQRRRRVAALHQKVVRSRADFQHKVAHQLVQTNDVICHEDLAVAAMVQNHHLARSINDAAWGQFIAILSAKAEGAGRTIIAVNPRGTSQTCVCGEDVPKTLRDRWHACPSCGLSLPRDQVSAMLIKVAGLGQSPQVQTWRDPASVA